MRAAGQVIAPDHDRFSGSEDALVLVYIVYQVLHDKAGAADFRNAHADFGLVVADEGKFKGTRDLLDQQTIVAAIRARFDARIVRWVRDDALHLLVLLARGPLVEPGLELIEIVASCFLEIGKVNSIIHMRQRVKVAEANLHRIPAREIVAHRGNGLSFLLRADVAIIVTDQEAARQEN